MRDILISTSVCVACLLQAFVSQLISPSTVTAAPQAEVAVVRSESKAAVASNFELDPENPNPTLSAIAPATILAATAGAAERCDVWEGLSALSPPV